MDQDIISQMTPMDWLLVAIVLGLVAFTLWIVYLAVEEPIKSWRKSREVRRKLAEAEAARNAAAAEDEEG